MITYKMLTYPITSKFGQIDRVHPTPHTGIDYACPAGTPAQALSDGTVDRITNDATLGQAVGVNAGNGNEWIYGHLSQVNVSTGQHVNTGDVLGLTGGVPGTYGAGHSTGAHLHLSLLQNGTPIDPGTNSTLGKFWDFLNTPGTDLAGMTQIHQPGVTETILNWLGDKFILFLHIAPEIFTVLAMACLLLGMVGSRKFMRYAGTCVLISFVGVILNAAI